MNSKNKILFFLIFLFQFLSAQEYSIKNEVTFVITTVTVNPNGDIIVGGANGEQITIPGGSNTVIIGGNGQIYNVDSQGNATGPFVPAPGGATTAQNTDGVASNGQAS
ncbi:hypothetical protein [Flavobacterium davisii]|uniref:hypothetical protein n=1 Tax=Flavobacterium davisii TaxID=2906077 RepID=UPI0035CF080D